MQRRTARPRFRARQRWTTRPPGRSTSAGPTAYVVPTTCRFWRAGNPSPPAVHPGRLAVPNADELRRDGSAARRLFLLAAPQGGGARSSFTPHQCTCARHKQRPGRCSVGSKPPAAAGGGGVSPLTSAAVFQGFFPPPAAGPARKICRETRNERMDHGDQPRRRRSRRTCVGGRGRRDGGELIGGSSESALASSGCGTVDGSPIAADNAVSVVASPDPAVPHGTLGLPLTATTSLARRPAGSRLRVWACMRNSMVADRTIGGQAEH